MNEYKVLELDDEGMVEGVYFVQGKDLQHAMDVASFEQLYGGTHLELWHNERRVALSINGNWNCLTFNGVRK